MLLLLFNGGSGPFPDVPLDELVQLAPDATHGFPIQRPAASGTWRFALELADPTAESLGWHDITEFYAGDRHQFGADDYMGRARARVVTVQLQTDDDSLAPWGQDTTPTFGVDVPLDAGLVMRAALARIVSGETVEWAPIWTGRVESWGDASASRGQIRTHVVTVVDTIADLANVPTIIETPTDEWPDWYVQLFTQAGWNFGYDIYGDADMVGGAQDLTLAAAIARMDSMADPIGLVWRSLRTGRIVLYPAPWDTTHTERYPNPLLDVYPDGLVFSYSPDFTDIEYIADDDQQPFGISRNLAGVLNYFAVTLPGDDLYAVDDPVSIEKYGVRPFQATWIVHNPPAVDDLLTARAYATCQALPLRTTLDHEGFWSALAIVDHLDPVTIYHKSSDEGLVVTGTGWIRNVVEERTVRGDGLLSWQSTIQVDIESTGTAEALLPVESLAFAGSETSEFGGPSSAEFTWVNPTQPSITPTHIQYRVIGRSLIWTDVTYAGVGADGSTVNWLEAATPYRFQVRLIRRVDGVVTNFSPLREVRFTTAAHIVPFPIPGDDPTDTDVSADPPDECDDFEVELQENDGTGWVTVDSFTGAELTDNGDGTFSLTTPIPNSFFNEGSMYRFRQTCDGITFETGPSFDPPDDWTDLCTTPPSLSDPPFNHSSLLVYVPKICAPDIIREAVSGIEGVKGDAYQEILSLVDDPNYRALLAVDQPDWAGTPGGILAFGECPQIVGATGDKSMEIRVNIPDAETCVLGECAAMRITCVPTASKWRAAVVVYKSGSTITLPTSAELDLDTSYIIGATHDLETGDIKIWVDRVVENTVGGTDNVPTINALPIWRVGAPPGGWVTDFAVWDSVIDFGATPVELTVTIDKGASQDDPANGGDVIFDVVFSESVSGFATGDVTLSGTAGATTATVTGSGALYTVTVTGMTTSGTVIASIGAAKATGDISGLPNDASTSTDNNVQWNEVGMTDYTIQIGGGYPNDDGTMAVTSGDYLLCAVNYRAGGTDTADPPIVSPLPNVQLSGLTSIYASAGYDTLGVSRGAARVDRATAASTGTMAGDPNPDQGQLMMKWSGLSGAPVQQARSTLNATDSCNISLGSAPTGTVIVIIAYGPGPGGANNQPAAPSGWTKLLDHNNGTRGFVVLQADTPQQTLTYSLAAGSTTNGGRDVVILEY